MKRTITISTLAAVVIAGAVMLFAGVTAPRTNATSALCHSTALSITAPASATAGKTVTVRGSEARTPAHTVKATLQSRRSTSKKWVNGASGNPVSYTHLRAHETRHDLVCRLLLEKKNT